MSRQRVGWFERTVLGYFGGWQRSTFQIEQAANEHMASLRYGDSPAAQRIARGNDAAAKARQIAADPPPGRHPYNLVNQARADLAGRVDGELLREEWRRDRADDLFDIPDHEEDE